MTEPSPVWRRAVVAVDQLLAPLVLFGATYLAALLLLAPLVHLFQWVAFFSAALATAVVVFVWDRGRWRLGLFVDPLIALRELAIGLGIAVLLIGSADLLIMMTTGLRHSIRLDFPAVELLAVFLPAVLHEELVFRGYAFQRLWRWKPVLAVILVSALFAALHAGNTAVSPIGLLNVFLGGILLSLAYIRYERLWLPIGLHLGWNLMSGPILGYEVSGYVPSASLLGVEGSGPALVTGGAFGIEGSIWMTVVESAGIALLARAVKGGHERHRHRGRGTDPDG